MRHTYIATALRFAASAMVLTSLTASCATMDLRDEPVRWRIVDTSTNTGVSEAAVMVKYGGTAFAPGHSTTTCSRAYFAFTDSDGWIDLPGLTAKSEGRFYVYKRGLVPARPSFHFQLREIYVRPARDDPEERLANLRHLRASGGCPQIGRDAKPIVEFLTFVVSEVKPAIRTPDEAEVIRGMELHRDMWTSIIQGKD